MNFTQQCLSLRYNYERIEALDQTLLPHQEVWIDVTEPATMIEAIQKLRVRGAPLIGVAAGLCLGMYAHRKNQTVAQISEVAALLRNSRPTAVNLMNAIDHLLAHLEIHGARELFFAAEKIYQDDVASCEAMANLGHSFIQDGDGVLTHCNTGGLATVGIGTALGVIRRSFEMGKKIHVYVDETRPLYQGGRLTAWELGKLGIPFTLICDNMAASLMRSGKVKSVFVGADRICRNRDVANKIGTYSVAVNAHFHEIPFYVVAPHTTFDPGCASGEQIPIEQRHAGEVVGTNLYSSSKVWNPAFDVTPGKLIRSIVTDRDLL